MVCVLVLALNGCAGCDKVEEVPENTPLPLEGNLEAKQRALGQVTSNGASGANISSEVPSGKRANPFLTMEEAAQAVSQSREVLSNVKVTAIFANEQNPYAIIDGFILRPGEKFGTKEVVKIEKRAVILKDATGEYMAVLQNE